MMRNRHLSRREFVARMSAAAAALAVGCGSDSNPLTGEVADGGVLPTPDPLPPGMDARVATANLTGYDTAALRTTLRDMVDSLGGFGNLVSAGDKVGIKLNLTGGSGNAESVPGRFGEPAAELFWTHPEIVRVVGEMFKDAGAGRIVLMEAIYDEGSFYNYGFGEVAEALDDAALRADAACSRGCLELSVVLLGGSLLYAFVPTLWWADSIAALVLACLIAREGVGAIRASQKPEVTGCGGCC